MGQSLGLQIAALMASLQMRAESGLAPRNQANRRNTVMQPSHPYSKILGILAAVLALPSLATRLPHLVMN